MGDKRMEDIMPVELAIQRELAYRRRIAMYGDSGTDLMPLQVQSSSQLTGGMKTLQSLIPIPSPRQTSSSSSSPSPSNWRNENLSLGTRGMKRQVPRCSLQCLSPQQLQPFHTPIDNCFCKICQVPCSSAISYRKHIKGQKHRAKLQEMKFGRKVVGVVESQRCWCELCKIWCMNEDLLKRHLQGQKHLQMLDLDRKDGGEMVKGRRWCELCDTWCMDEDSLKQHLKGKKHVNKLQKRAEGLQFQRLAGKKWSGR